MDGLQEFLEHILEFLIVQFEILSFFHYGVGFIINGKHVALQEKEMSIGLEVFVFRVDLVIYGVPYGLHVPRSSFSKRVPPWNEYNIHDWKWSLFFSTQFLSDSENFLVFVLHMQLKGVIGESEC